MSDILELIATHEAAITSQWSRALRLLPGSPYQAVDDKALKDSIRRSCQALLQVMQTGDTAQMAGLLHASAASRLKAGVNYEDSLAAWLLYRQAVQQVLMGKLSDRDSWDQLVDRVDAVLGWVKTELQAAYDADSSEA